MKLKEVILNESAIAAARRSDYLPPSMLIVICAMSLNGGHL
ncbi:hypothetical protein [Burkholderia territorii]|nr:hypothetical protein [Burkholderia territorii]